MIFVTVGTQLPFDRLVRTVDQWAGQTGRNDILAQIGPGGYRPRNFSWYEFLDVQEFDRHMAAAELIVSHAGMGTIISALELGKPILVMPRRAALNETRNDHQVPTARELSARGWIHSATDEQELMEKLHTIDTLTPPPRAEAAALGPLVDAIRRFISGYDVSGMLGSQHIACG